MDHDSGPVNARTKQYREKKRQGISVMSPEGHEAAFQFGFQGSIFEIIMNRLKKKSAPLLCFSTTNGLVMFVMSLRHPLRQAIRYDKQLLPKAMQLRRGEFGKKGQAGGPQAVAYLANRSYICRSSTHI